MIVEIPWGQVPGGARVRLSSGRVVHVLDRVPGLPSLAVLRNSHGATRPITVDPAAMADVLFDTQDAAVAVLRAQFPAIEFLREEG